MIKKKVIVIGGEHAHWPLTNAKWLAEAGFDVHVLFFSEIQPVEVPSNINFIRRPIRYSLLEKAMLATWGAVAWILALFTWMHFRKRTGRNPMISDLCLANNIVTAQKKSKIIDSLHPDVVVGHNISLSGLTVAYTQAKKKVLIGWSGDMSEAYHTSILQYTTCKYIVAHTDLFIAASETALQIFGNEFSIDTNRLFRTAWQNKNLAKLLNYDHSNRIEIRKKYRIPSTAKVVFHARRFKPQYWAMQGFDACLEIAKENDNVWFLFIEGINNEKYFKPAQNKLKNAPSSISKRFIMLSGELPFQQVLDLFSISDIFLSLRKKGDMRSATVLQGAAMGVIPVLARYSEWIALKKIGFEAFIADPDAPAELRKTLMIALNAPKNEIAQKNRTYLKTHERDEVSFILFSKAMKALVDK